MIADLRYRLNNHRKPVPPLEGIGFEYGFNSNILDGWLRFWAEEYPFKEREIFLNKYPQYVTNIQGLDIHFIKYRQKVKINCILYNVIVIILFYPILIIFWEVILVLSHFLILQL